MCDIQSYAIWEHTLNPFVCCTVSKEIPLMEIFSSSCITHFIRYNFAWITVARRDLNYEHLEYSGLSRKPLKIFRAARENHPKYSELLEKTTLNWDLSILASRLATQIRTLLIEISFSIKSISTFKCGVLIHSSWIIKVYKIRSNSFQDTTFLVYIWWDKISFSPLDKNESDSKRPNFQVFVDNSFSIGRGGATLFSSRDCDYFFPTNTNTHSTQIQAHFPHKYTTISYWS